MVHIDVTYEGDLRTSAVHGPSGQTLITDAPVDNHGRGEAFSPTDLVATAMASCVLTLMGIMAKRHDWPLEGATARVEKSMSAEPPRRIASLSLVVTVPGEWSEKQRSALEKAALGCPVHATLHGAVEMPVRFNWG